jgi:hypothetical protein
LDDDGDGFPNDRDACPLVAGPHQGCPFGDRNTVELHIIDQAKSGACPDGAGSCRQPLSGAKVRVFDRNRLNGLTIATLDNGACTGPGVTLTKNPDGTLYDDIFECAPASAFVSSCITDSLGVCIAGESGTGDYLVVVKFQSVDVKGYTGLPKGPGDFIDSDGDGRLDLASKEFQFIKVNRKDGSVQFQGGRKTVITGSMLEVFYPVEAVWEEGQTRYLYPFIFASDSDWQVDVCAEVPAGYDIVGVYDDSGSLVSSTDCMQAFVSGQTKVAAFEVAQTGSPPEFALDARLKARGPNGRLQTLDLKVPSVAIEKSRGKVFQTQETPGGYLLLAVFAAVCSAFVIDAFIRSRRK